MDPKGFVNVRESWAAVTGSSSDLAGMRRTLQEIDSAQASWIAKGCGLTPAIVRQWMKDQRWFSAEDALAVGLVDEIGVPAGYGLEA